MPRVRRKLPTRVQGDISDAATRRWAAGSAMCGLLAAWLSAPGFALAADPTYHVPRPSLACQDPMATAALHDVSRQQKVDQDWVARVVRQGGCYSVTPDLAWHLERRADAMVQMRYLPRGPAPQAGVVVWFRAEDLVDARGHTLAEPPPPPPVVAPPAPAPAVVPVVQNYGRWQGIGEQRTQAFHADSDFVLRWSGPTRLDIGLYRPGDPQKLPGIAPDPREKGKTMPIPAGDYILVIDSAEPWILTAVADGQGGLTATGGTGGFATTSIDLARPEDKMPRPVLANGWLAYLGAALAVMAIAFFMRRAEPNWRGDGRGHDQS